MAAAEVRVRERAVAQGTDPDAAVEAAQLHGPPSGQVGDAVTQKAASLEELYAKVRASKELVTQNVLMVLIRHGLEDGDGGGTRPPRRYLGPGVKGIVRAKEKIENE